MYWIIDEKYSQTLNAVTKVLEAYINFMFNDPLKRFCSVAVNPFYNEFGMFISFPYDSKRVEKDISGVFKVIQNIAEGNINLSILSKAKNAMLQLYKDADNCSHYIAIANSYACLQLYTIAP